VRLADRAGRRVRAVVNRGLAAPDGADPFLGSEWLAAWWAALRHFDGPVVNRPGRDGFLPEPWPWRLEGALAGFAPSGVRVADRAEACETAPRTTVHRLASGAYAGCFDEREQARLAPGEVYALTPLDPRRTSHLLLAGERCFDLVSGEPLDERRLGEPLERLLALLRAREALLAGVLVELADEGPRLLRVLPAPAVPQRPDLEQAAHAALLGALGLA